MYAISPFDRAVSLCQGFGAGGFVLEALPSASSDHGIAKRLAGGAGGSSEQDACRGSRRALSKADRCRECVGPIRQERPGAACRECETRCTSAAGEDRQIPARGFPGLPGPVPLLRGPTADSRKVAGRQPHLCELQFLFHGRACGAADEVIAPSVIALRSKSTVSTAFLFS